MALVRFAARFAALAIGLAVALPAHALWRLFRRPSPWPRRYLGFVAHVIGARVRVIGTPRRRNVVFVANHLSWIDIPLLAGATGSAFIAKAELRDAPLVGWLCTLNRTIFVARQDRLRVTGQIDRLRAMLAEAQDRDGPVAIFPEGTTGDGMTLLPFKATLLAALDPPPPGIVIQPVRIDYGDATPDLLWLGDEHGRDNARRILSRRGRFVATLHFLTPFDPAALPGRKAIAAEARRRILSAADACRA